ncbi:MAG: hypothetical protein IJJ33_20600, partial [Victivallales bacterium]|nr:hypothetical protein [Victivallales bacterium]
MQSYSYSVFSIVAIVIHLMLNFNLLRGRGMNTVHSMRYRGFLIATLAYYLADSCWGILAGLGWTTLLYIETIFFFLSLVAFACTWCHFVISYLDFEKCPSRILSWFGFALLAFNIVALVTNPFNRCFYHLDAQGNYQTGALRDPAFYLLVAFYALMAILTVVKVFCSTEHARRRCMMVAMFCTTMAAAVLLQVIWPLTPFTSLGCLVGNCFLHVFVVADEQAAKHMAELEKALVRARTAEKSRSMFFSIVSHDIRTPLNAILGYSELLQQGIEDPGEREEAFKSIRASGTTLLQLVNDVLDLAKMNSGTLELQPTPM